MSQNNGSKKSMSFFKIIFIFFVSCIIGFFGLVVLTAIAVGNSVPQQAKLNETVIQGFDTSSKLAVIDINGVIMPGKQSDAIIDMLKEAGNDTAIKGIILNMDTPGGGVTATDVIYHEVQKLRQNGKKVVTCMQSVAASGGYYLAAGSDYIVANKTTITGSIGVIISTWNGQEMLDKIGIKPQVFKSGRLKDGLSPGRMITPEETQLFQGMVNEMFNSFVEVVAEGRKLPIETVKSSPIGDARIVTAKQALELKLIDKIGYLEDAIAELETLTGVRNAQVVKYEVPPTVMEVLMGAKTDPTTEAIKNALPKMPLNKAGFYYLAPGFY
ncbi:MAG: signal peptide peptidase SppA [Lentisphaerales bacterium]|nr:signal peptide peptidase SppA [Lentisphaerales bacterium]